MPSTTQPPRTQAGRPARPAPHRTLALAGAVVVAAALAVGGPAAPARASTAGASTAGASGAAAAPEARFSVRPAQEGSTPLPGGHFDYSVPAGAVVHDGVVVENLTDAPLSLQLFAADLIPLAGGGFGVAQRGQPTHGVASWTTLPGSVSLSPLGQATVPFTVSVPAGVLSGDYGGAVVAQDTPTPSRGIAIQTRVALQVRLHVTGTRPRLAATVGALSARRDGGTVRFSAVLTNTGNESFTFDGGVVLDRGRAVTVTLPLRPARDYLFPGQKVTLTGTWGHPPRFGQVSALARVTARPLAGAPAAFGDHPVRMSFFPWLLVILGLLALLLLLVVAREEWRRRGLWTARWAEARRRRQAVRRFKRGLGSA